MFITYLKKYLLNRLSFGKRSSGGRNFLGRVCIIGRCLGNKKRYIYIDIYRRINQFGSLLKIFSDGVNRTAFVGIFLYHNGLFSFDLITNKLKVGMEIFSGEPKLEKKLYKNESWNLPLKNISLFSHISCLELKPFIGSKFCRAAGTSAIAIGKINQKIILKMPSGWQFHLNNNSMAKIGILSNLNHKYKVIGKAGKAWSMGFRPKVRGVAKNPCDHAHGGGNGKSSKPVSPMNAKGVLVKTPTNRKLYEFKKRRLFKIL